ncbi:MAG: hypothetical protein PHN45_00830 [Methylococcales bacterium]|nr:hypothetical protein [Methylococcales bacterium]
MMLPTSDTSLAWLDGTNYQRALKCAHTADATFTLPSTNADTVVTETHGQTLTNKTLRAIDNTIVEATRVFGVDLDLTNTPTTAYGYMRYDQVTNKWKYVDRMQTSAPLSINDGTNTISALVGGTTGTLCAGNDGRFYRYNTFKVSKSPGPGEYSHIIDAVNAVIAAGDASEYNRYIINIDSGTYIEPQLNVPDYTLINGADIYSTIVQHDDIGSHDVTTMGNQCYLRDLTIIGSSAVDSVGVRYTGLDMHGGVPADSTWMQMDHVQIQQCSYCIYLDNLSHAETYLQYVEFYCPYVECIYQTGTHFFDPPANTQPIVNYLNMENTYIYSDDSVMRTVDIHVTGPGSFVRFLIGGITNGKRSDLFDEVPSLLVENEARAQLQTTYISAVGATLGEFAGIGLVAQSGAGIMGTGMLLLNMKKGVVIPNVGAAPSMDLDVMTSSSSTECIRVDHPTAYGNMRGNTKLSKTFVDDANVTISINMYDNDLRASRFMVDSILSGGTSMSTKVDIVQHGYTQDVGLVSGGLLTDGGARTVNFASGVGFISTGGDTLVQQITFSGGALPLPSDNAEYLIVVDSTSTVGYVSSFPHYSDTTKVLLGCVVTGTNQIVAIHNVTPTDKHKHRANKIEHAMWSSFGTLTMSGFGTSLGSDILSMGSGYYTIGSVVHSVAGCSIPSGNYRVVYVDVDSIWKYSAVQTTTITSNDYNPPLTGGIVAIPAGDYAKHSVFVSGDMADGSEMYFVVLAKTTSPLLATIETDSADSSLPTWMYHCAVRVCDIIVHQGGTPTLVSLLITQPNMLINKWNAGSGGGSGGGGTNDHSLLLHLLNDDHPQYLRTDGSRTWTGANDVGGYNMTNVGTINSVSVQAHASRHVPTAADPLPIGSAYCSITVSAISDSSRGVANSFALSDHSHTLDATGVGINTLSGTLSIAKGGTGLTSFNASRMVSTDVGGNLASTVILDIDGTMAANSDTRIPSQKAVVTYVATSAPSYSVPLIITLNDVKLQNSDLAQVTLISTDGTLTANSDTIVPTQKAVKTYVTTVAPTYSSPVVLSGTIVQLQNSAAAQVTSISIDGTFAANSDIIVPTQKAVRTYVASALPILPSYSLPVIISLNDVKLQNSAAAQVTSISIDGTMVADSDTIVPTQKAVRTYVATVAPTYSSPVVLSGTVVQLQNSAAAQVTSISIDGTFVANSDTIVPTQKAVRTYVTSAAPTYGSPVVLSGTVVQLQNSVAAQVTSISIDGTLAANSDVIVPTQQAVRTYVTSVIPTLTASAPVYRVVNDIQLQNSDSVKITSASTDGTLTANSDALLSTQKAIKTYVDAKGGVSSITGTANQVIVSNPTGAVTLSLPQSIGTTSSPTFASINVASVNYDYVVYNVTNRTSNAVLTSTSTTVQILNSGVTQMTLPLYSTMTAGRIFEFWNLTGVNVTIKNNAGGTITTLGSAIYARFLNRNMSTNNWPYFTMNLSVGN